MGQWQCFMVERLNKYQQELRRFVFSSPEKPCSGPYKYHTTSVVIGIAPSPEADAELEGNCFEFTTRDDPRWPTTCSCGYVYQPEDEWQQNSHRLYRSPLDGTEFITSQAPIGAMWNADWMSSWMNKQDGMCLTLQTPAGPWPIDGPSSNGPGWERTGIPPKVTANPSIHFPGQFHGWLRDGILVDC